MEKIIYSLNQEPVKLQISPPGNLPSFFVFGIYKSGSTMQNGIFKDICTCLNIPIINIPRAAIQQGVIPILFNIATVGANGIRP